MAGHDPSLDSECPFCRALREELVRLARQKLRYWYRRLGALLEGRGHEVNVKRVYPVRFPDYEPTDHTAKRRKLSELQGQHPMVLVLSRGGYCPKSRRQAEPLVQFHREI